MIGPRPNLERFGDPLKPFPDELSTRFGDEYASVMLVVVVSSCGYYTVSQTVPVF